VAAVARAGSRPLSPRPSQDVAWRLGPRFAALRGPAPRALMLLRGRLGRRVYEELQVPAADDCRVTPRPMATNLAHTK
jgi:hypothetical protein